MSDHRHKFRAVVDEGLSSIQVTSEFIDFVQRFPSQQILPHKCSAKLDICRYEEPGKHLA